MIEHLRDGSYAKRFFLVDDEPGTHVLEESFELAEEQVVLITEVQIEGGTADGGAVEDVLHGDIFNGSLVNQLEESHAEPVARAAGAGIGFAVFWPARSLSLRVVTRVSGDRFSGHWLPLCSASRNWLCS
jgi:hypothetical protein